MRSLYSFGIRLYRIAISIASLFNKKAALWIDGRRDWRTKLTLVLSTRGERKHTFWFHCASLGEYEQALPLIKDLKSDYPTSFVLVSFFSPSGFQNFKANKLVDGICYLPLDTITNARDFIDQVKPTAAFFVKYEIWHHFITQLYTLKVPTYLISANFRSDQIYFKGYGVWFRETLFKFSHIFVQQQSNIPLLSGIGVSHCSVSGDTRVDRVLENLAEQRTVPQAAAFVKDEKAIILGSAWNEEVELIKAFLTETNYSGKIIIAPHEVHPDNVDRIAKTLESFSTQRFSTYDPDKDAQILIIDSIGQLRHLYAYAKIAVIGGGFGSGLHNVLEAVTFGIPVLFGPNIQNFPEASELVQLRCAYVVNDSRSFNQQMNHLLSNPMLLKVVGEMSRKFIRDNSGATQKIISKVGQNLV